MTWHRTPAFLLVALAAAIPFVDLLFAQPPTPTAKGRRVALLVGVNEYTNRNLENLKYAERDITELAAVLKSAGFEVRVLLGSADGTKAATRLNIEAAFAAVLNGVGKADTVLLGFAGHGQQLFTKVKGPDGRESVKEIPFFCPKEAVPADPTTLVSLSEVLKTLDERGGGHNLLLVDACRNVVDPNRGSRGGIDGTRVEIQGIGTAAFFSCSPRQRAMETDKAGGGHGVFFHFVIEGLKGEARNRKGQVTWDQLIPYVKRNVKEELPNWFSDLPESERQVPVSIGNVGDDPVLVTGIRTAFSPELTLDHLPADRVQILKQYPNTFRGLTFTRGNRWLVALLRGNGTEFTPPDDPRTSRPEVVVWDLVSRTEIRRWTIRSGVA